MLGQQRWRGLLCTCGQHRNVVITYYSVNMRDGKSHTANGLSYKLHAENKSFMFRSRCRLGGRSLTRFECLTDRVDGCFIEHLVISHFIQKINTGIKYISGDVKPKRLTTEQSSESVQYLDIKVCLVQNAHCASGDHLLSLSACRCLDFERV